MSRLIITRGGWLVREVFHKRGVELRILRYVGKKKVKGVATKDFRC